MIVFCLTSVTMCMKLKPGFRLGIMRVVNMLILPLCPQKYLYLCFFPFHRPTFYAKFFMIVISTHTSFYL